MGTKAKYLNPNIYRRASELLDRTPNRCEYRFVCLALDTLTRNISYGQLIRDVFEPSNDTTYFSYYQNGAADQESSASTPLGNLRRKIALDLMAELIETGDINDFI